MKEIVPSIYKLKNKNNKNLKYNLSFFGFLSFTHYVKFIEILSFFEIFDNSLLPLYFSIYNKIYDVTFITFDLFNKNSLKQDKLCNFKNNFNWIYFFFSPFKLIKQCLH